MKMPSDPTACLSKPIHYVDRFCSKLSVPDHVVRDIQVVATAVHENRLVADNTASSIAAAVIYLVTSMHKLELTKEEVSRASKISEVTIGKCYKKLMKYDHVLKVFMQRSAAC